MLEFLADLWYTAEDVIISFTEDHPFVVFILYILLIGLLFGALDEANVR